MPTAAPFPYCRRRAPPFCLPADRVSRTSCVDCDATSSQNLFPTLGAKAQPFLQLDHGESEEADDDGGAGLLEVRAFDGVLQREEAERACRRDQSYQPGAAVASRPQSPSGPCPDRSPTVRWHFPPGIRASIFGCILSRAITSQAAIRPGPDAGWFAARQARRSRAPWRLSRGGCGCRRR